MKILYRQPEEKKDAPLLSAFGIQNCYFKHLSATQSVRNVLRSEHFHTDYEVHLVTEGVQVYQTEMGLFSVSKGNFLLVPPSVKHYIVSESADAERYALTFSLAENQRLSFGSSCFAKNIPDEMATYFSAIMAERKKGLIFAESLIEGHVLSCLLLLARQEEGYSKKELRLPSLTDARVAMAKQYIEDNITAAPNVAEIAAYCHVSKKQLSRLFYENGLAPIAAYVRERKIVYIQKLVTDPSYSLSEISDIMGFSSEYAFHSFFKKYCGMPPGKYRKMIK